MFNLTHKELKEVKQSSTKLSYGGNCAISIIEEEMKNFAVKVGLNTSSINKSGIMSELINFGLRSNEPIIEIEGKKISPLEILTKRCNKIKSQISDFFFQENILYHLFKSVETIANDIKNNYTYEIIYDNVFEELESEYSNENELKEFVDKQTKKIEELLNFSVDRFTNAFHKIDTNLSLNMLDTNLDTNEHLTLSQLAILALTIGGNSSIKEIEEILDFNLGESIEYYFLNLDNFKCFEMMRVIDSFSFFEAKTKLDKLIRAFIDYIEASVCTFNPNKDEKKQVFPELIKALPEITFSIELEDDED